MINENHNAYAIMHKKSNISTSELKSCQPYLSVFIVYGALRVPPLSIVFLFPSFVNDCEEQGLLYSWPYYLFLTAPLL